MTRPFPKASPRLNLDDLFLLQLALSELQHPSAERHCIDPLEIASTRRKLICEASQLRNVETAARAVAVTKPTAPRAEAVKTTAQKSNELFHLYQNSFSAFGGQ